MHHFTLLLLLVWTVTAACAPFLPLTPNTIDLPQILAPPSAELWLGADDLGRPLLDRLMIGARTAFIIGIGVVSISAMIGALLGASAGYFGGSWDAVFVRIVDVFLAFPGLLLAIALAGLLGPGVGNLIIALATVGWVSYARLTRAQVLALRRRDHISAACALGVRRWRIIMRHLLPLTIAPLTVEATFGVAGAVLAEASLSFLGLGVQPPTASWGCMIRDGVAYLLVAPHVVMVPGVALLLVVVAVNLAGDQLRDYLDVRGHHAA